MPAIISKSSFDRFGDDLSEVILSFLSIEEKFRFECLSKQWKQCIYQKQNHLKIDFKMVNKLKRTDLLGQKYLDIQLIESLLKKCPFITRVSIETIKDQSHDNYRQLIGLIIKYCKCLNEIDMYFDERDAKLFQHFLTIFGLKLKKIGFNKFSVLDEKHLVLCKNLREINIERLNYSNLKSLFFEQNKISLKKLRKFQFIYSDQESEGFKHFVEKCKNNLKVINVKVVNFDESSVTTLLNGIQELKALKVLRLNFDAIPLRHAIGSQIKQIGINCPLIEYLILEFSSYDLFISYDIFNQMKHFSQLKRLEFKFFSANRAHKDYEQFKSDALKDCHQLTHLNINCSKVCHTFFQSIGSNVPKLQYLKVSNAKITEKIFQELSLLVDLRSLELFLQYEPSIEAIEAMIDKFGKIRSIYLNSHRVWHLFLNYDDIKRIKSKSVSLSDIINNSKQQNKD